MKTSGFFFIISYFLVPTVDVEVDHAQVRSTPKKEIQQKSLKSLLRDL